MTLVMEYYINTYYICKNSNKTNKTNNSNNIKCNSFIKSNYYERVVTRASSHILELLW